MLTFLQSTSSTSDTNSYTFSTQNLGTASADRYILVTIHSRKGGATTTITGVTVGGVTATIVRQRTNTITNSDVCGIALALVPTGATGDVVVTFGATMARCAIGMYHITELKSTTPYDEDDSVASDPTANLDIPASGFAIAAGTTAANSSASWTGLTEDFDAVVEAFVTYTGGSMTSSGAEVGRTITIDFASSTEPVGIFVSFEFITTQGAIVLSSSNNFADGANTTPQLPPPSGKTTANFTTGEMSESSNPVTAIDIGDGGYTEVEFCLQATSNAEDGATYEFRVTNNGTPLDSYSQTPEWTIGGASTLVLLGAG